MDTERRELLTWLGIAGGVGISAVVGTRALDNEGETNPENANVSTESVRHEAEFDTVVNAADAGGDPAGDDPINDVLESHAGDNTLLSFPEGTYRLRPIDLSGYTNLGMAAAGEARPTFQAVEGHCLGGGESFVRLHDVKDLLLDGIEFDFDAAGAGGVIRINATGDATVRNIAVSGGCNPQVAVFRIDILDADGTGLVERLNLDNRRHDIALTGIYVGRYHAGEVRFKDCNVQGFTDNGLYGSPPGLDTGAGGTVHVEGGTYRNNNIANVRLGSEGSVARDVEAISDAPPPTTETSAPANARGFRLRNGQGQLIEDCTVRISEKSRFTHGGIVFHQTNGGATVRGTTIEVDRDNTPAIRAFPRDNNHEKIPVFENVEITGSAKTGETVMLDGRDGAYFRDCRIETSGDERNGIYFRDSNDCRIVDSHIDVSRNPLILRGSTVRIENTTLITPDGREEIDEMEASDEDFTPRGEK